MRKSFVISLAAVFAALHAVLYFVSFGLWRNWAIYLAPIEGIVLGPWIGFLSAFLGSSIARMARPDLFWMFGIIAEPISVLVAGLLARSSWKPTLSMYVTLLLIYLVHPLGRALPLWTILDVLVALFLVLPAAKLSHNLFSSNAKRLSVSLVLASFVCIATDSLVRIILLVPTGLHTMLGLDNFEALFAVFVGSAIDSYVEDVIVVIVSLLVGVPLLFTLSKSGLLWKRFGGEGANCSQ